MKVGVEIAVECSLWEQAVPELEALVRRVVDCCFEILNVGPSVGTEISLLFCDDREIRTLNSVWRKQDKATNVLSFPAAPTLAGAPIRSLGDIALAYETIEREASAEGKTFENHVAHLIAHGVLHLLGHDHELAADAELMEAKERAIMARLDIPDPYGAVDGEGQ
jgi:probable rRNA maturation factor